MYNDVLHVNLALEIRLTVNASALTIGWGRW